MPRYIFECDGMEREFVFSMREAPSIGDTIERDGKTWRRIPSPLGGARAQKYEFVSRQLPKWYPHCDYHDKQGRACFSSKAGVERAIAASRENPSHGIQIDAWD